MGRLRRASACAFAAGIIAGLTVAPAAGQTPAAAPGAAAATRKYSPPRTPDGRPDLGGVWANNNITPLQRPKQWEGKQLLTEQELAELKQLTSSVVESGGDAIFGDNLVLLALERKTNASSRDGCRGPVTAECVTSGNYNSFWLVDRDFHNPRTSLVVDPPDGKIPSTTPDAQRRAQERADHLRLHPADGPEDRPLGERCLTFGVPRFNAAYMSYAQIVQTPTHVVILNELGYEARLIPTDGRPHIDSRVRHWNGDPRGRWEGDTLVVETTNFSAKGAFMGATEELRLVERFTRVSPEILDTRSPSATRRRGRSPGPR